VAKVKRTVILWLITILVLLPLSLSIGCGAEPAQEAPPPTLETLTYTNSDYAFSVEYPKDWDFEENIFEAIVVFMGPSIEEREGRINIMIMLDEVPESPKLTLDDYHKLGEMNLKRGLENYYKVDQHSATVADLPAIVSSYTFDSGGAPVMQTQIIFLKENVFWTIGYTATPKCHSDYEDCLELLMTTFEFK
jgi:hypothetical protein